MTLRISPALRPIKPRPERDHCQKALGGEWRSFSRLRLLGWGRENFSRKKTGCAASSNREGALCEAPLEFRINNPEKPTDRSFNSFNEGLPCPPRKSPSQGAHPQGEATAGVQYSCLARDTPSVPPKSTQVPVRTFRRFYEFHPQFIRHAFPDVVDLDLGQLSSIPIA